MAGAALSGAAIALAPLYARSAFSPAAAPVKGASAHHSPALALDRRDSLPEIRDPFARLISDAATRAAAEPAALPVLPPNRGAFAGFPGPGAAAPIVRGIVSGEPPFALVDDGLSIRIVGRGDRLSASRVRAITDGAVILEDGRNITLPAAAP